MILGKLFFQFPQKNGIFLHFPRKKGKRPNDSAENYELDHGNLRAHRRDFKQLRSKTLMQF